MARFEVLAGDFLAKKQHPLMFGTLTMSVANQCLGEALKPR